MPPLTTYTFRHNYSNIKIEIGLYTDDIEKFYKRMSNLGLNIEDWSFITKD